MKNLKIFQGLNKFKQMKILYGVFLVLMVFVSACAQQAAQPVAPPSAPEPEPEAAPEPEPEAAEGTGAAVAPQKETAPAVGDEVRMLGVGQYDPEGVTISAGGLVIFFNEGDKKTVVTIKGPSGTTNTPLINTGEKYEQAFEEAGSYDAWAVAYGPGVKITVK